jgi:hypothetical protein
MIKVTSCKTIFPVAVKYVCMYVCMYVCIYIYIYMYVIVSTVESADRHNLNLASQHQVRSTQVALVCVGLYFKSL